MLEFFKLLFRKSTLISALALMVFATTSVLALTDRIDGPTYFSLTILLAGSPALFKAVQGDK